MKASRAVTVKLKAVPAVAEEGAETEKWVAAPALTAMLPEVPVMEEFPVSVAVMVWLAAIFNVALKVPVPPVNVEFAGSTAVPSVLAK